MTIADPTAPAAAARRHQSAELLAAELQQEAATTRRVLERLPEDRLSWRPHPKSMSLGQLAMHVAGLPLGIAQFVEPLVTEFPEVPLPEARTREEVLALHERSVGYATERLAEWGDAGLAETWTLTSGSATVMQMPRGELLRMLMFNHVYHHRGQLTVYLRLLEVPVPSVYGPTADENPFAG